MGDRPLFVLVASYPDSVVVFRGDLLREISRRGCGVLVIVPAGDHSKRADEIRALGCQLLEVDLQRTGMNPFQDVRYAINLYKIFRQYRPNYVLSYTAKPVIYGTIAAWLAGVPEKFAMITGLGYAFARSGRKIIRWITAALYRLSLGKLQGVFFQNPDDEALFRQSGILPGDVPSIVVNGSGVNTSSFVPHELPRSGVVFLMIGRLLGDKGVREYVGAARLVRATGARVRFMLVGWIDSNPDSISQHELDLWVREGLIDFRGKLSDVRPAIAESTVYVLPSYREGTPRTVLEAMAMGRPIITTDAPGCRETVVEGRNGFLVPVGSIEALAASMFRFIHSPDIAVRMGIESRKIAEEKYDARKVNAAMLQSMGIDHLGSVEDEGQ